MEFVWLIVGFITGGLAGATLMFLINAKKIKRKEEILDGEIKGYRRAAKQLTNFLSYDGTSTTQEEID